MNRCPERGDIHQVTDAVSAVLAARGISEQVRVFRVHTEWRELVGSKVARWTLPTDITEKRGRRTLWIDCASSVWLNELNLLRTRLLKRLNDVLAPDGETLFDEIRLRLASGSQRLLDARSSRNHTGEKGTSARRPKVREDLGTVMASHSHRDRIAREVAAIEDADLRELIARVRLAHDC